VKKVCSTISSNISAKKVSLLLNKVCYNYAANYNPQTNTTMVVHLRNISLLGKNDIKYVETPRKDFLPNYTVTFGKTPKYRNHTRKKKSRQIDRKINCLKRPKWSDLIKKNGDEMILHQIKLRSDKNTIFILNVYKQTVKNLSHRSMAAAAVQKKGTWNKKSIKLC
jgi:hypothetical protein